MFDNGLALGADGLELDVHVSRDGVAVVHHDPLLDRTTDAWGPMPACRLCVPERAGNTRVVSRRFVRMAHQRGIAVQVWTVDNPADIRRLLDWGVDAIITDRPDVAVPVLKEWMGDGKG